MRIVIAPVAVVCLAAAASAQVAPIPSGIVALEMERSRRCVGVLERLDALDAELAPLAERSRRLLAVAEGVALEDDRILDSLDATDPIEAAVQAWYTSDQELARRYVATLAQELNAQRTQRRDSIKVVISAALATLQEEADETISATGDLDRQAGPCDGAIFVRPAVLEACESGSGAICEQARLAPSEVAGFRFVDSPESVWEVQVQRPWTDPTPLRATPDGQLDGARTIGFARNGNIVVTVAFSPLLRDRAELGADEAQRFQSINDSLGFDFSHPDLAFTPALSFRATLGTPIAEESSYVLHFGSPEDADVLWTGAAGGGVPLEQAVPLGAVHVGKLQAGQPIALTGLRAGAGGTDEAVFTIALTAVNQARASQALVGYMAGQLGRDLANLVRPRGSQ